MADLVIGLLILPAIVGFAFGLVWLEGWWYRRHRTPEERMRDAIDAMALYMGEQLLPAFEKLGAAFTAATIAFAPLTEAMRRAFEEPE